MILLVSETGKLAHLKLIITWRFIDLARFRALQRCADEVSGGPVETWYRPLPHGTKYAPGGGTKTHTDNFT
jgi:hypothetical protein